MVSMLATNSIELKTAAAFDFARTGTGVKRVMKMMASVSGARRTDFNAHFLLCHQYVTLRERSLQRKSLYFRSKSSFAPLTPSLGEDDILRVVYAQSAGFAIPFQATHATVILTLEEGFAPDSLWFKQNGLGSRYPRPFICRLHFDQEGFCFPSWVGTYALRFSCFILRLCLRMPLEGRFFLFSTRVFMHRSP